MSYTLEQITILETAIAQGALTVEYADKKVTYRSLDEMLRILSIMKGDIEGESGTSGAGQSKRFYGQFSKGNC